MDKGVYCPIALLFIYAIIKVLPLQKWFPQVVWKHIERTLLVFGVLGSFAALTTGETAEHLFQPNHQLVEMHALFATVSTWIFAALLVGELLSVFAVTIEQKITSLPVKRVLSWIAALLTDKVFSTVLAFVGLITISVTGLLGGVMVYGLSADPVAEMVVKLLGITL